jgi:hypothetical protein
VKSLEFPMDHIPDISKGEKYSVISEMAVRILLPFSTRKLCELGVWTLKEIVIPPSPQDRNRLGSTDEETTIFPLS